jgi:V8-like Glu-specific endopeptidase
MSVLPEHRIQEIVNAFLELPVTFGQARPVLFNGLPPGFVALLLEGLPPLLQLQFDLGRLNQVERLANGIVPLEVWLSNAVRISPMTEQQKVFQAALDDVGHIASGTPRLNLTALPETKEVIVHQDDMLPFSFLELGIAAARSVAKLRVPRFEAGQPRTSAGTPVVFLGTGWLLTPTLLMTNHHVVNARKESEPAAPDADLALQARGTSAQFGFDGDGMEGQTVAVHALEAWSAALDYALLRIADGSRPALRRAAEPVRKTDGAYIPVNVIQHPEGTAKKLGIRNNLVTASTETDLRYFTDTKQGSSGSPVLDDRWQVVALHRGATFAQNVSFQGRSVAFVNVGTHLASILDDLRNRFPALAAELA